jgi:protein tyrosine phosphatase
LKLSEDRYINANFIPGKVFGISQNFIATQGPLKQTVGLTISCFKPSEDFWVMIDEYKSPVIAMVTTLEENGKSKCHQYWPNLNEKLSFESVNLLVETVSINQSDDSEICVIQLKIVNKNEERIVEIVQYLGWKDHSTPDLKDFTSFEGIIDEKFKDSKSPMVVHCSAGSLNILILILQLGELELLFQFTLQRNNLKNINP